MPRPIPHRYDDPLDLIWLGAAAEMGLRIHRSDEVYASWDGRDTLTLCTPAEFDPDDSLAQLILHEICHHLVQGPSSRGRIDWGLDNTDPTSSALAEHACHRLQAALLDRHGLRPLLAVTTDWRPYWDALPEDPLAPGDDPAIALAREAWPRARSGLLSAPLARALQATSALADIVRSAAPEGSSWSQTRPKTPVGEPQGPDGQTCASCTWAVDGAWCRQLAEPGQRGPSIEPAWPACRRYEPVLTLASCGPCGACCREGFHIVALDDDDAVLTTHPELVVTDTWGHHLPRPGGRCVALEGGCGSKWRCRIYADRPTACRDFDVAGDACLEARQRVGLSRS